MIEKILAVPRINKLRVINIYEADHILMLKYFWPKQSTKHAVKEKKSVRTNGEVFQEVVPIWLHSSTSLS